MPSPEQTLPGYRRTLTAVGATFVLLGGSMLVRGSRAAMTPFGVPEQTLASPHFADFFHFLFVHMAVLGIILVLLGRLVLEGRSQRLVARVLLVLQVHYTWLDVRTSDSPLGNHLYQGPGSLGPVVVDVLVLLAYLVLSVRPLRDTPR